MPYTLVEQATENEPLELAANAGDEEQ